MSSRAIARKIGLALVSLIAAAMATAVALLPGHARRSPPAPQPITKIAAPMPPMKVPQTMVNGIWRVDGGFMSDIKLQNGLTVAPIAVSAILYMADGTPYALPPIEVPASGSADINVNMALMNAPSTLAGHISQFGSAAYSYVWDSPGHVTAEMTMMDDARSLVYSQPFAAQVQPSPAAIPAATTAQNSFQQWKAVSTAMRLPHQTMAADPEELQALWWKHDPDDEDEHSSFTIANVTAIALNAQYRLSGERGTALQWRQVYLPGHGLARFNMDDMINDLPQPERRRGGLDILLAPDAESDASMAMAMPMPNLMPAGGMENARTGYSANLDFQMSSMDMGAMGNSGVPANQPSALTFGAAGIMIGRPLETAGFPLDTFFTPYAYLRNTTKRPIDIRVHAALASENGAGGFPLAFRLPPGQTIHLDLASYLPLLLDRNARGLMMNWSLSYTGMVGDLDLSTGSVDQSGSYVFSVVAQREGPSAGELLPMWSLDSGDDTMMTLWNQSAAAEDIEINFNSADGKSQYLLPLHIGAQGSAMVDLAMLKASGQLDPKGRAFPQDAVMGNAMVMPAGIPEPGANGRKLVPKAGFWTLHDLVVSSAVFNVRTATCCYICTNCCGYSCPQAFVDGTNQIPLGNTLLAYMTLEDVTGGSTDCTDFAVWSSPFAAFNGMVTDEAQFTATAVGNGNVNGDVSNVAIPYVGNPWFCPCGCPFGDLAGIAGVGVYVPSCTLNVTLNGSKSAGDSLIFPAWLNQALGLQSGGSPMPGWYWALEVSLQVNDDATRWSLSQNLDSLKELYILRNPDGSLQPQQSFSVSNHPDGPPPNFTQQLAGNTSAFWLDGPGQGTTQGGTPLDSFTLTDNFTGTAQSTISSASCSVQWYVHIVVAPHAVLDTTNSSAGLGHISGPF